MSPRTKWVNQGSRMSFQKIDPEELGAPKGWTNGMLAPKDGRILFVAGQAASDATGHVPAADFVTQFGVALDRILVIVREAGGDPEHIGRMTVFVSDMDAYRSTLRPLGEAYRARMGLHFPAMALVEVSRLVDPNAMVEIEATAVLP